MLVKTSISGGKTSILLAKPPTFAPPPARARDSFAGPVAVAPPRRGHRRGRRGAVADGGSDAVAQGAAAAAAGATAGGEGGGLQGTGGKL